MNRIIIAALPPMSHAGHSRPARASSKSGMSAIPRQTIGTRLAATAAGEMTSISIGTRHRSV
jgi:hypothetical protein